MLTPWKKSYDQPREHIQKQRHYFANKGPSSQGYGFSSGHVWMWELDREDSWVPKNLYFWTVVLEKTLESPWDCKEIQSVHSKGISPGCSLEGMMIKLKLQYFGELQTTHAKSWLIGKDSDAGRDWGQEEKGATEDKMAEWHHQLDGYESEWTSGVGDGQGGLACCDSWGRRVIHDWATELNWTECKSIKVVPKIGGKSDVGRCSGLSVNVNNH